MSARRRFAALATAAAAAGALGGCGSSKTLPSDIPSANANGLVANLSLVLSKCNTDPRAAASAARQYETAVNDLPDSVDPEVRKVLTDTANNLTNLAGERAGCESGATGTSGLQGVQPETTASTTSTPVVTETTTTTPSSTTTQETQPPAQPPASGNGQGPSGAGPNGQDPSGPGAGGQGSPSPGAGGGVGIGNGN